MLLSLGEAYRSLYIGESSRGVSLNGDMSDVMEVNNCKIFKGDKDDYINEANWLKFQGKKLPNSISWRWLTATDKKVGVMIAGNLGRPGGACVNYDGNVYGQSSTNREGMTFKWVDHKEAKTQEESTISCLGLFHKNKDILQEKLFARTRLYGMRPPQGDDSDFQVKIDENGSAKTGWTQHPSIIKVNVFTEEIIGPRHAQKCRNVYEREYGFDLKTPIRAPCYISFVVGPNASEAPFCYRDRGQPDRGLNGCKLYELATVPRTRSGAALASYNTFKRYIQQAIKGSLCAMSRNGVKRAIIAPISTGLYAGKYYGAIREPGVFFNLAVETVMHLQGEDVTFEEILIQEP